MLTGFLVQNFEELVSRTRANASARRHSEPAPQLEERIPLLLARLRDAAGGDLGTVPHACGESGCSSAARHAGALLEKGWPVSQVVHDCAAVRQAITRLAIEKSAAISLKDLEAVSCWLDTAIAETVAEYAHLKEEATCHREVERLGQVSHDLRTQLQTALLSFRALKKGTAAIDGSAGEILGRSLERLRELVDTRLPGVGLASTSRVSLAAFVHEVAVAAHGDAERRDIRLKIEAGDPALAVDVDPQLLASALMNLLQNAFESTPARGCVTLRTRGENNGRVVVEVEDECGGMAKCDPDPLRAHDRRGSGRSAPGGGLSSSRRAVQANGGEVHTQNLPGKGCIFGIQLPAAAPLGAGPES